VRSNLPRLADWKSAPQGVELSLLSKHISFTALRQSAMLPKPPLRNKSRVAQPMKA
jgi:hypothetical protein